MLAHVVLASLLAGLGGGSGLGGGRSTPTTTLVSVKDFGAQGDGTTNDVVAIQAAIDSVPSGGTIWFPRGTYLVNASIKTGDNKVLAGEGRGGTEIKLANSANVPVIKNNAVGGDTRLVVRDMAINGNKANNTSSQGIVGIWFVVRLEGLWLYNFDQEAVWFKATSTDATVIDVHETYSDTIGLRASGDGLYVVGGAFEYNGVENFRLEGRTGFVASYSEGDLSLPSYGLHIKGGQGYTVSGMQFTSELTNGVRLTAGAHHNNIVNNWISNATAFNIYADSSTYDNYIGANYTADYQLGGIVDQGRNVRDDRLGRHTEQRISWNLPLERSLPTSLLTYRSFEDGDEWTSALTNATASFVYYRTDNWRDGVKGYKFLRLANSAANGYAAKTLSSPTTGVDLVVLAKQMPRYSGGTNDGRISVYDSTPTLLGASDRYSGAVTAKDIFLPVYIPGGTTSASIRLEVGQTNDSARVTEWNEVDTFYAVSMNGDMERPFTSGEAENWGCFSGATCTDETTIKYQGSHSQKVSGNNPALLQQSFTLTDGQLYRARVAVYLASGSVKVGIGDTTTLNAYAALGELGSDSTGRWVVMDETFIKHAGIGSFIRMHATASTTVFYVDSVAIWPIDSGHAINGPTTVNGKLKVGGVGATAISKYLSATTTWDPASRTDGTTATTTVTVTGAALGDVALASFSLSLQGMLLTAYVSAANTVTIVLQNETGGTLDLASGTVRASVIQH